MQKAARLYWEACAANEFRNCHPNLGHELGHIGLWALGHHLAIQDRSLVASGT